MKSACGFFLLVIRSIDLILLPMLVNLLEWPAAAFPTGLMVDTSLDIKPLDFNPANETEEQLYSICECPFLLRYRLALTMPRCDLR